MEGTRRDGEAGVPPLEDGDGMTESHCRGASRPRRFHFRSRFRAVRISIMQYFWTRVGISAVCCFHSHVPYSPSIHQS